MGVPAPLSTIAAMHSLVSAEVWHYWIAFPLVAAGGLAIVWLIVGYLVKVVGAKPPRSDR